MHPNPAFRTANDNKNLAFARDTGFGTLAISGSDGLPLLSHIPFVIDGNAAYFHLVRSNPIMPEIKTPRLAKLAVTGPHGYVSPDWYDLDDQVPTWNYVAVHLSGQAELLPPDQLLPILERLSDHFEAQLQPKPIWKTAKLDPDQLQRLLRMIVPVKLTISDVQGTWKLGQNKPESARLRVADTLTTGGVGSELATLAALMRQV